MTEWPSWWDWELELSSHLLKRMLDRDFSEVDLRSMMEQAVGLHSDIEPGRWVVQAQRGSERWEVIVEPDAVERLLVVITAYPLDPP